MLSADGTPQTPDPTQLRFCVHCGYNLHGLDTNRCPECGEIFDPDALSQIPWEHRKRLGGVRAFLSTMTLAIFHPGTLARAVAAPVDPIAARRFRFIVVFFASCPFIVWLIVIIYNYGGTGCLDFTLKPTSTYLPPGGSWWQFPFIFSAGATLWGVMQIAIVIAFALATSAPRRLIASLKMPLQRHSRAAAASDYLCAPLALLAPPVAATIPFAAMPNMPNIKSLSQELLIQLPVYLLASGLLFLPLWWWWNTIFYATKVSPENRAGGLFRALCLPLTWAISIAIAGGVFPFIVGFIWLMIDSFRK